ncbi:hypothetical protein D9758_001946 [Tetrapyrgos nigripes]|uniref:BRCT domain-containing protein n=1 Tax=Tetrapyrgos nigripes TaxID=182062 RepID=A0A8H5GT70_9AGAR|nr:hypothetical protein D9758_001946 [Tetrapyrgos nigripes]
MSRAGPLDLNDLIPTSMFPFRGVKYHLAECLPPESTSSLTHILNTNGATCAESLQDATHVITNSNCFEGYKEVSDSTAVVTEKMGGTIHSPLTSTYSPDPSMLFSGVVGCATELRDADMQIISAGITALGGQWRSALSKDVTHLFAISSSGDKYRNATTAQEQTKIKIVLPHWFDDSVRLGLNNLETEPYEWPDPPMLEAMSKASSGPAKKSRKLSPERQALLKTALWDPEKEIPTRFDDRDIFGGRRVLLGLSLELGHRRGAVEAGIERTGGIVVDLEESDTVQEIDKINECDKIDECDIFVTRYRSGKAYYKAVRAGKTIGSLAWLFHVQSVGVLKRPLDQLLHYPIPRHPPDGFSDIEITVSNYTGENREYLKKIIETMGAKFTPSMSKRNKALIAAHNDGQKAQQAVAWYIPVVNHLWLEDCFIKWHFIEPSSQAKYTDLNVVSDFSVYLGNRGVGSQIEDLEEIIRQEAEEEESERQAKALSATQHSVRDVTEVARELVEADGWDEDDAAMDVDERRPGSSSANRKAPSLTSLHLTSQPEISEILVPKPFRVLPDEAAGRLKQALASPWLRRR